MTATTTRDTGTATAPGGGRIALAAVLLGALIGPMLMSGTTIALPAMGSDLDASGGALQWIVTGYFLSASCFMLVAGSLADRVGRRRVLRYGAVVYAAGTAVVAAAPNIWIADAARTASGVGAAGIIAAGGALLAATFDGPARTRAFAALGTVAGVGLAIGPTVAGQLVGGLGWRGTFLVFAVLGSLVVAGTIFAQESRSDRPAPVDWPGAGALVAGLGLVMLALTQSSSATAPVVLGQFVVGAALLAGFAAIETRTEHPLLDLGMLRDRHFAGWCLSTATVALGSTTVLVTLPTYLQGAGGDSPGRAGATMLMLTLPVVAVPSLGAFLVNRGTSPRLLITVALVAVAAGNAWLTVLHPAISAVGLLGPLAAIGAGTGLAIGITDARALALVPPARVGMASGLLGTVRGGSNAVLLAVFGAVLLAALRVTLGDDELARQVSAGDLSGPDSTGLAESLTAAWKSVLLPAAILCAACAGTVAYLLRPRPDPSTLDPSSLDTTSGESS